jgi:hypothetical protein
MVKCLSDKPCTDPIELAGQAAFFSTKLPVGEWYDYCEDTLKESFPSDYYLTFASMVMFALYVTVPKEHVVSIWTTLANAAGIAPLK